MELSAPGPVFPIPEDIQKAISQAKDNVTVLQAECDRLRNLRVQLEMGIRNDNEAIVAVKADLAALQGDYEELLFTFANTRKSITDAQTELSDRLSQADKLRAEMLDATKQNKAEEDRLGKLAQDLDSREAALVQRETAAATLEASLNQKQNAIQSLASLL